MAATDARRYVPMRLPSTTPSPPMRDTLRVVRRTLGATPRPHTKEVPHVATPVETFPTARPDALAVGELAELDPT